MGPLNFILVVFLVSKLQYFQKCDGFQTAKRINACRHLKRANLQSPGPLQKLYSTGEMTNSIPGERKAANARKSFSFGFLDETLKNLLYTDKESNRKFRRTVFTKHNWQRHRSSNRYFQELRNMPKSVILRGLGVQTLVVTFFSLLIVSYNTLVETKRFSFPLPLLSFPALPFALTSSSLGLLLVFRTNAAYSRWKDARVSWALISARSFDLMRQSILWMPSSSCKSRIVRYTTAFAKVAKWHLGHQGNDKRLRGDLDRILTAGEIDR